MHHNIFRFSSFQSYAYNASHQAKDPEWYIPIGPHAFLPGARLDRSPTNSRWSDAISPLQAGIAPSAFLRLLLIHSENVRAQPPSC